MSSALECLLRLDLAPGSKVLAMHRAFFLASSQLRLGHLGGLGIPESLQTDVGDLASLRLHHNVLLSGAAAANTALLGPLLGRSAATLRRLDSRTGHARHCFEPMCTRRALAPNVTTLRIVHNNNFDVMVLLRSVESERLRSLCIAGDRRMLDDQGALLNSLSQLQFSSLCRLGLNTELVPFATALPKLESLRLIVGTHSCIYGAHVPDLAAVGGLRKLCLDLSDVNIRVFPIFHLNGMRLDALELRFPERVGVIAPNNLKNWTAALLASQPTLPRLSIRCGANYIGYIGLGDLTFDGALRLHLHFNNVRHPRIDHPTLIPLPTNLRRLRIQISGTYMRFDKMPLSGHATLEELSISGEMAAHVVLTGDLPSLKAWRVGDVQGNGFRDLDDYLVSL